MPRAGLMLLFAAILAAMIAVTVRASLEVNILDVGPELTSDPWFHATLADAYFGFITFYVWVCYKEHGLWRRALWLLLIMSLGNIAMAIYMLIQLVRLGPEDSWDQLLLRQPSRPK